MSIEIKTIDRPYEDTEEHLEWLRSHSAGIYTSTDRMNLIRLGGFSPSQVKTAAMTPYHWWHKRNHPELYPFPDSGPALVGTFLHAMILEPDTEIQMWMAPDTYTSTEKVTETDPETGKKRRLDAEVTKKWNGNAKACKEMVAAAKEKYGEFVFYRKSDIEAAENALNIVQTLIKHLDPQWVEFLYGGHHEIAVKWWDAELDTYCLAIMDTLYVQGDHAMVIDLKTTGRGTLHDQGLIERKIATDMWHIQVAMMMDGISTLYPNLNVTGAILAAETAAPFLPRELPLADNCIEIGRKEYRRIIQAVLDAKKTGAFHGYPKSIVKSDDGVEVRTYGLPGWYRERGL